MTLPAALRCTVMSSQWRRTFHAALQLSITVDGYLGPGEAVLRGAHSFVKRFLRGGVRVRTRRREGTRAECDVEHHKAG